MAPSKQFGLRDTRWLRWTSQTAALMLVLLAPAIGVWGVRTARVWSPEELDQRYGPLANGFVQSFTDLAGAPADAVPGAVVGGTWSAALGPIELADPIAALEVLASGAVPSTGFLIGAAAVLLLQVAMGRFFCGYLCPYGTLSRLVSRPRQWLRKTGLTLSWRPSKLTRFALLGAVLAAPLLGASVAPMLLPYLVTIRLFHAVFWGGALTAGGLLAALLLSDLLLWEHGVCRSVCPSGALQSMVASRRVLNITTVRGAGCDTACNACASACWLGLDPRNGQPGDDCDSCGRCIPTCPNTRLQLRLQPSRSKRRSSARAGPILLMVCASSQPGCDAPSQAPSVVTGTRVWSSPFMPPAESDPEAALRFVERTIDGRALSVGVAEWPRRADATPELALRIFMESAPGEPWTGPLTIEIANRAGSTRTTLAAPSHPRSVPRPSLFEVRVQAGHVDSVALIDGPMAGEILDISRPPSPLKRASAPILTVFMLWCVGILFRLRTGRRQPQ